MHILDFCHAVDHLAEVCKVLWQGTEQFDKQLQQWRDRPGGRGMNCGSATLIAITADIQGEINYFERTARVSTTSSTERTTCRGSGTVESACKNVVAAG